LSEESKEGVKFDQGKLRYDLLPPDVLEALAQILTDGAVKYSDNGWLEVPDGIARYSDAMGRHLLKEAQGEKVDPSGALHAAHVAWNALARLEIMLRDSA
jgi:hypothetical protein